MSYFYPGFLDDDDDDDAYDDYDDLSIVSTLSRFPLSEFVSLSLSLSHSILNDYYYYFSFDLIAELKFFEILSSRFVITLMIPSLSHLNQIHFDSAVFFFE